MREFFSMWGSIRSSLAWVIFATALPCVSLSWNSDHDLTDPCQTWCT